MLPRYHPQFAKRRAFSDADTSKTINGVTRPALLFFQAAAPGRKPSTALKAAPTIPLSLHEVTPMSGGPIFAFHISSL